MSQSDEAYRLVTEKGGPVSLSEFLVAGVAATTLGRMVKAGVLEKPAAGHYALAGSVDFMDADWVAFALQVPRGVIGLFTAAVHHGITQEMPPYLQAFVPRERGSRVILGGDSSSTRVEAVISRNELHLTEGVEVLRRSGTDIAITSKERTLLDMFLFSPFNTATTERSARVPEESFLDALRRCTEDEAFSFDRLGELGETFKCEDRLRLFTKTARYDRAQSMSF